MPRILLVDDDRNFATNLQQLLEKKGYSTDVEFSTHQAIERFKSLPYDFLITDIRIPGEEGGLEIIRECKNLTPKVKIITISGGGYIPASDYLRISQLFGADSILQKPFFIEDLIAEIEKLSNGKD
ncbi:MAG: response regulator [Bacteroidales bacterium]